MLLTPNVCSRVSLSFPLLTIPILKKVTPIVTIALILEDSLPIIRKLKGTFLHFEGHPRLKVFSQVD